MSSSSGPVTVTIDIQAGGSSRDSFDVPLFPYYHTLWPERVRYYTDLPGLVTDGFAATSRAYLAAQAFFAEGGGMMAIGRLNSSVILSYTITVPTSVVGQVYTVTVDGVDYSHTAITADPADVANALSTAVNASPLLSTTYVALATTFDIDSDTTGNDFCVTARLPLLEMLDNTPDGATLLSAELAEMAAESDAWYVAIPLIGSKVRILSAATYAAANGKGMFASTVDTASLAAAGGSDIAQAILDLSRDDSMVMHHDDMCQFLAASVAGRTLKFEVGSVNFGWQASLSGVSAVKYTSTQIVNAKAKRLNLYREECGGPVFLYGATSSDARYFDIARGADWLAENIQKDVCDLLKAVQKVPYTTAGQALIMATVFDRLQIAVQKGILSAEGLVVTFIPVEDIAVSDRSARCMVGIRATGTLTGAVNEVPMIITLGV